MKTHRTPQPLIDVKKLQDPQIQEQFAIAVENKFEKSLPRVIILTAQMKSEAASEGLSCTEKKKVGYLKRPSNCVKKNAKPRVQTDVDKQADVDKLCETLEENAKRGTVDKYSVQFANSRINSVLGR